VHETDQGEVKLNLVVQGYCAQLMAQFQKSVIVDLVVYGWVRPEVS